MGLDSILAREIEVRYSTPEDPLGHQSELFPDTFLSFIHSSTILIGHFLGISFKSSGT